MPDHLIILAIILAALVLFALEIVRPDLVAIGVALALMLGGFVSVAEGFSGFSNPAVITVIGMFILSAGLVRTGVAESLAGLVASLGGRSPALLTAAVMLTVGSMSAFMNNIGAVAVLLPTVFVIARRSGVPASRLLIPLSFGSLMGGLVTMVGTPPNLLVAAALQDHGYRAFRLFDFAPTGLAVMAAGVLYMVLIGRHLIPLRGEDSDLTQRYELRGYLTEVAVPAGSRLEGRRLADSGLRDEWGLDVLRITRQRGGRRLSLVPTADTVLEAEDRLIVEGDVSELMRLKEKAPLQIHAERKLLAEGLADEGGELVEVVVAPGSAWRGRTIKEIDVRRRFGVLVLALRRRARTIARSLSSLPLQAADVLLIQGSPQAIAEMARSPDFLVVKSLAVETQRLGKAGLAAGIMALSIVLAATGLLHISVAAMLGALLMALTGCVEARDIYRAVEWRVVFLIACMMPLSIAMDSAHAGTAAWLAGHVVAWAGGYGPLVVMASLFVGTSLITEVMSNAAATVLVAPIAIGIAEGLGLEPYPFLVAVGVAASTTFLTPIGHQANVLVYGAGGYRFTDFARVGFLLNVLVFVVVMAVIPLVWPFTPLAGR